MCWLLFIWENLSRAISLFFFLWPCSVQTGFLLWKAPARQQPGSARSRLGFQGRDLLREALIALTSVAA